MKLEQLNTIEFNISTLTNQCYIGQARSVVYANARVIVGDKREVTKEVLSAVAMIISNNNKIGQETILIADNGLKIGFEIREVVDEL